MSINVRKKAVSVLTAIMVLLSAFCGDLTAYAAGGSWRLDAGGWWYEYDGGGCPAGAWEEIDGYWYYFNVNGYMSYSEYRDGCWLNADGVWDTAYSGGYWASNSTGWWYTDSSGWYPVSQWLWIDGGCYYFKSDGYMASNEWIDGCWVGADGAWDSKGAPQEDPLKRTNWKDAARAMVNWYDDFSRLYDDFKDQNITWDLIYVNDDDIPELATEYYHDFLGNNHKDFKRFEIFAYNEANGTYESTIHVDFNVHDKDPYMHYLERKCILAYDIPVEDDSGVHVNDNDYVGSSFNFLQFYKEYMDWDTFLCEKRIYDDGRIEYIKTKTCFLNSGDLFNDMNKTVDISKEQYDFLVHSSYKTLKTTKTSAQILKQLD